MHEIFFSAAAAAAAALAAASEGPGAASSLRSEGWDDSDGLIGATDSE